MPRQNKYLDGGNFDSFLHFLDWIMRPSSGWVYWIGRGRPKHPSIMRNMSLQSLMRSWIICHKAVLNPKYKG